MYHRVWVSDDFSIEQQLEEANVRKLLAKGGGYAVRNVFDFDRVSSSEFWYIVKDSFGGMEELSAKTRNQVRRCFRECDIRMVTIEEIKKSGYTIYKAAHKGYKVKSAVLSQKDYEEGLSSISDRQEFWGAFDKQTGIMIAYAQNIITGEVCNYSVLKAIPDFQKRCYPYYGLIYEMNRHYLVDRGYRFVSDGARTMTNHSNVQQFLVEKFAFRKAYCHMKMYYKWWLRLVVKLIYPFRRCIRVAAVNTLLRMEEVSRSMK